MPPRRKTKTSDVPAEKPARGRGRPRSDTREPLSREIIIERTLVLTKTTPLHELSIIRVAREIGVAPALVHYYLGGREPFLAGVINAFHRTVVAKWPKMTGEWKADLVTAAHHFYDGYVKYAGIASYAASHTRFRLARLVDRSETDFGLVLFEHFAGVVRSIGLDAHRTAMYLQLFVDFFVVSANATVEHRWPEQHGEFMSQIFSRLDPEKYPHATFIHDEFVRLNAETAFVAGLGLMVAGVEHERAQLHPKPRRAKS